MLLPQLQASHPHLAASKAKRERGGKERTLFPSHRNPLMSHQAGLGHMATYGKTGCKRECLVFSAPLVGGGEGRRRLEIVVGLACNSVGYSVHENKTGRTLKRTIQLALCYHLLVARNSSECPLTSSNVGSFILCHEIFLLALQPNLQFLFSFINYFPEFHHCSGLICMLHGGKLFINKFTFTPNGYFSELISIQDYMSLASP